MNRTSITVVGESGSGLLSVGKILCEGLRNRGYWLNADREYPSLIKGGQSSFTINFSDQPIYALEEQAQVLVSLDKKSALKFFPRLKRGGIWIHGYERLPGMKDLYDQAKERGIHIVHVPIRETAHEMGGTSLMKNVVLIGMAWKVLGFEYENIKHEVEKKFGKKPALLPTNLKCLQAGFERVDSLENVLDIPLVQSTSQQVHESTSDSSAPLKFPRKILLDGNHAVALGAVHAGTRFYCAYPMSPSSSILTHMANMASAVGMVVKQGEDEITVANMTLGAAHAGTRAMCATSGGGFDLMTETVSLAGITEIPWVCCVVQRPGPATGLPTWTGQGDLNLAIFAGHGEYGRMVVSVSDPVSAFELTQQAHNFAEKFQMPVVILSDKLVAETLMTVPEFAQNTIPIERGLTDPKTEKLTSYDRYEITKSGVSKRWVPGSDEEAYYFANSDEHDTMGRLTEESQMSQDMYAKRVRKLDTLRDELPEPEVFGPKSAEISFVGWGSTKNVMRDIITMAASQDIAVNYLHYDYVWPLKTERFEQFLADNSHVHLIEGNMTGQLGQLLASRVGKSFDNLFAGKFLKWDGRPFWVEEVMAYVENRVSE